MVIIEATAVRVFNRYYSAQASSLVPVIKVPAYVKKHVEKAKKAEALKLINLRKRISYRGDTSFPVISCTDKQYNFYLGQRYNQFYPLPLLSKYWFKTKSSGQKFTIQPWDENPSLPVLQNKKHDGEVYSARTFSELLSDENILQELANKNYESPTPVQVLTIPAIFERKHVLLAAETGCGKTVAYLAPIIQNISAVKKSTKLFPNTPLALIITPGRELAEQIGNIAYDLSKSSGVRVGVLISDGTKYEHLKLTENSDVDILVASFGSISKLHLKRIMHLTNLRHIVLDEADTLLDDSFIEEMRFVLRRIPNFINSTENLSPELGTQMILVSSIYPTTADELLQELCEKEDVIKIKSPYLHRVLAHVKQRFRRVSNDSRAGELLELVKLDIEKKQPVMVFATHSDTCDWLGHFLEENGVPCVLYHAGLSTSRRSRSLRDFTSGICNVMCCSDLASRGLDTQHVKHVINFDFPTSVSDYILRAGRVGRVGSNQGYVTNFVVSKASVYAVQEIERAVRLSTRIPDVDSNIKRKINKMYFLP